MLLSESSAAWRLAIFANPRWQISLRAQFHARWMLTQYKSASNSKTNQKRRINMIAKQLLNLHREEEGQDLIEYALVVALIALAATAGMSTLATAINVAFGKLGSMEAGHIC